MPIPTALITYNRPHHTARVLAKLWEHRVEPLFVFSDGPKGHSDIESVHAVRRLIDGIAWTRPTVILRDENIGLQSSVTSAVDRVLRDYETVVVLEDDCVPGPYFFEFVAQCLTRYADNERVMSVGGYTVPLGQATKNYPYDAYFFPRIESWGWATWRRAWQHYEYNIEAAYERAMKAGIDLNQGGNDVPKMIQRYIRGHLDAWSPGWLLAVYLREAYCVYPTESHIQNIGFDGSGVHCGGGARYSAQAGKRESTRFPQDVIVHQPIMRAVKDYLDQ